MAEKKLHSLLVRQIRRHLNIDIDSLPQEWDAFMQAASAAYTAFDDDRKMLERTLELSSQELLQANSEMGEVYKAFPDLFFRLDKTGTILSYNAGKSSDIFLVSKSLIGKKMQHIPVSDVRSKFEAAIRSIQDHEELVSIEYSMPLNGQTQHYEARFVPLLEENIFVIIRNITNRRRSREALLWAKKEAEEANLAKSRFLANMSHELRTPLNAIIGYGELIQEQAVDMDPEKISADIEKIISSGKHLLALINDVLDLAKIEAQKMELQLETSEISSLIIDISTTIAPLAKINDNTLNVTCPNDIGSIHTDLLRLRQVLYNLLSNACKFTKRGAITIEVRRSPGDWIDFRVIDTGIGIAPDKLGTLFDPFSQIDISTSRSHEGTGLGLTISMRFIEMLGGKILVESKQGKGSEFTLRLPASTPVKDQQDTDTQPTDLAS